MMSTSDREPLTRSADTGYQTPRPSTDPLQRLGDSLTLCILVHLPRRELLRVSRLSKAYAALFEGHASGIFRPACHRDPIDSEQLRRLQAIEAGTIQSRDAADSIIGQPDQQPRTAGDRVDWKHELKQHVVWDRNWRNAQHVDKWILPSKMDVWRFKIDPEDDCCIMTTRGGRLEVVDNASSTPLFFIEGVRPYAHLEFAKGFAVFDNGRDTMQLEVWRNRHALSRSPHPNAFGQTWPEHRPMMVEELLSSDAHPAPAGIGVRHVPACPPLTRGNLAFYRHITPPVRCRAFRARVDYENTPKERSIVCAASHHGIYIYNLEDGSLVQHIKSQNRRDPFGDIMYVELDDDYVHVCFSQSLRIYPRHSQRPPFTFAICHHVEHTSSLGARLRIDVDLSTPVQTLEIEGETIYPRMRAAKPAWQARLRKPDPSHSLYLLTELSDRMWMSAFIANDDLVYVANPRPYVYITREYRSLLTIANEDARRRAWADHTIQLDLSDKSGNKITHLATDRSHVIVVLTHRIFCFDTSTLPTMCTDADGAPCICTSHKFESSVTAPKIKGLDSPRTSTNIRSGAEAPQSTWRDVQAPTLWYLKPPTKSILNNFSSIQADKDNIYATVDIENVPHPLIPHAGAVMQRQDCVRVFNFAPIS